MATNITLVPGPVLGVELGCLVYSIPNSNPKRERLGSNVKTFCVLEPADGITCDPGAESVGLHGSGNEGRCMERG